MPALYNFLITRFAACFIWVKTRALLILESLSSEMSRASLSLFPTKSTFCAIRSTAGLLGVILTRTGFLTIVYASASIFGGMVAEKNRVWRSAGM